MTSWSYTLTPPAPISSGADEEEYCLSAKTDVVASGLDLLLAQFKEKPRIEALLSIYLKQVQEIEDALWLLLSQQDIDQAAGIYLDRIGDLVGQPRSGHTDAFYRPILKARILANRSKGTQIDIAAVIDALFASPGTMQEDFPAKVVYDSVQPITGYQLETIFQVLRDSVSTGVQFMFIYQEHPDSDTFTFAPANVVVVEAAKGFADTAQTTGGRLRNARVR